MYVEICSMPIGFFNEVLIFCTFTFDILVHRISDWLEGVFTRYTVKINCNSFTQHNIKQKIFI